MTIPRIAVLSDAVSPDNRALLARVRRFCADHSETFHYELDDFAGMAAAIETIGRVEPAVLVLNGGDRLVQAALTALYRRDPPMPPVAILPGDKTSLIHRNFGAEGDPMAALQRVLAIVREGVERHVVRRELIALESGSGQPKAMLGMFLGGGGIAEGILFCRRKIYPLGLPVGLSHVLAMGLGLLRLAGRGGGPRVSVVRNGEARGQFTLVIVTTLERLLLRARLPSRSGRIGALRLLLVEARPLPMLRAFVAMLMGRFAREGSRGFYFEAGDEIRIEGERSAVLLDGELIEAAPGQAIVLRPTLPVPFLSLAA